MSEEPMTQDNGHVSLSALGIRKEFPGVVAVDFDPEEQLQFRGSLIHALAGENGAGKSTLVSLLAGIYQPTAGRMQLNDEFYHPDNVPTARRAGVEIVLQEPGLVYDMSVADNIFLAREDVYARYGILDPRRRRQFAQKALEQVHKDIDPDLKTRELSLEDQKFVELARALFFNPHVLIIDEMTASLTDTGVDLLFSLLRELRDRGMAIIYISHYLEEVFELCDQITVMKDGRLVKTLPIAETNDDEISTLMVGRATRTMMYRTEQRIEPSEETVLSVRDLSMDGRFQNVSFDLHRGEIIGIGGLLGCGNEDLAMTIFGAEKPTGGEIELLGEKVVLGNPRNAIRHSIAYVPKDRDALGLILRLELKDNIVLPSIPWLSRFGFLTRGKMREIAARLITTLQIAARGVDDLPINMSGGNRQKVVLAKWLVRDNEVLILNNPTRGIDVGTKTEVYGIMREIAGAGKSILLITDELAELINMSDEILIMRHGEVSAHVGRDEEPTEEELISYML